MLPLAELSQNGEIVLVLASGSARRRQIFETAGFRFECITSNFAEDLDKGQFASAEDYVRATSLGKLEAIPKPETPKIIQITCDTVVVREDGKILEKPGSFEEAYEMIWGLIGQTIKVVSVVHLRKKDDATVFQEVSEVVMRSKKEINAEDIHGYLNSVNYKDLAGGLAIQSCGMVLVKEVRGCYSNVMGFPMSSFYQKLKEFI